MNRLKIIAVLLTHILSFNAFSQNNKENILETFWSSIINDGICSDKNGNTSYNLTYLQHYQVKFSGILEGTYNDISFDTYKAFIVYLDHEEFNYSMMFFESESFDGHYELALRLYGYKENDFIHFYNYILCNYMPKRKIPIFLEEWQKSDLVFLEIDFDCFINSIKTNNRKVKCMESIAFRNSNIFIHLTSPNRDNLLKSRYLSEEIYAYFSNKPFYGRLPLNIGYRKMNRINKRQNKSR